MRKQWRKRYQAAGNGDCEFGKYRLDNRKGYRGTAKCTEQGIHLVFANLPDVSVIKRIRNSWNCLASKNYSRSGNGEGNGFVCESDAWRRKHL